MSKFDKSFYDKDYYFGEGKGQYHNLSNKKDEYNTSMAQRALCIKNLFKPESVLELGCGTGQFVDMLRMGDVKAVGIDISEYTTKDKDYLISGDVSVIEWPDVEMVCSFDLLEHLTEEQINIVIDKCSKYNTIFHSISTGFEDYGDVSFLKDMDKSHISMYSPSWWFKKFYDKYNTSYFITVMTRQDYVYAEEEKYKFTNTNFLLTKKEINVLQII